MLSRLCSMVKAGPVSLLVWFCFSYSTQTAYVGCSTSDNAISLAKILQAVKAQCSKIWKREK